MQAGEIVDARKHRCGRDEALALLDGVRTLVIAGRGGVKRIDFGRERPDDDACAALMLGPTGNLRAPTLRVGTTLVVGFSADAYADVFD